MSLLTEHGFQQTMFCIIPYFVTAKMHTFTYTHVRVCTQNKILKEIIN